MGLVGGGAPNNKNNKHTLRQWWREPPPYHPTPHNKHNKFIENAKPKVPLKTIKKQYTQYLFNGCDHIAIPQQTINDETETIKHNIFFILLIY